MKIYTNNSLAETQRLIEKDETRIQQLAIDNLKLDRDDKMTTLQTEIEQKNLDREQKENANIRDNDTRLLIE